MPMYPRLNIGAGARAIRELGQINADLYPGRNIDAVFDASKAHWPFDDNSIDAIAVNHVLEHLPDPFIFFKEAYRVLAADGTGVVMIRIPHGSSNDALGDLTHLRQFLPASFACFQPGYGESVFNLQYDNAAPFGVMSVYERINPKLRWLVKPVIRRWGLPAIEFLWGGYVELFIKMRALKSAEDVTRWRIRMPGNMVPVAPCIHEHEYHGVELEDGVVPRLLFFGESAQVVQRISDQERGLA